MNAIEDERSKRLAEKRKSAERCESLELRIDEALKADGVQRLVILPLYPQFSISTSGSSLRLLEKMYYTDQVGGC